MDFISLNNIILINLKKIKSNFCEDFIFSFLSNINSIFTEIQVKI